MYKIWEEKEKITFLDEEENRRAVVERRNYLGFYVAGNPAEMDEAQIEAAVRIPVDGGKQLSEIVKEKRAKTACILVSDATRGVPTKEVAPFIISELMAGGIDKRDITFIVALGVHRDATREEMREFLGTLYGSVAIENHDAWDERNLVYLGETSRHTPVKVNKKVYESDIVVTIGKVELHDMAGFSGGRKSILPGVASEETIVINHRPEMIVDPGSYAGNLSGNPIHEDMLETAYMCGVDYGVNLVMNQDYKIAGVFSGELNQAHLRAAEFLKSFCQVELPQRPDIYMVCPGKPLSIDMYQGVKAMIAFHKLAEEGNTVILYGDFKEGINSGDFHEPFEKYPDLDELKDFVWKNYKIQMDHIVPIWEMLKKKIRILVVSENVSKEDVEIMHMEKCESLQEALDRAIKESPKPDPKVAFCPQSYRCIWKIKE